MLSLLPNFKVGADAVNTITSSKKTTQEHNFAYLNVFELFSHAVK